jgi:predicted NUDIX family NTP pyrophosphohydrolase
MPKISAGLLMYRVKDRHLQVFARPSGGPFFKTRTTARGAFPKASLRRAKIY